MQVRFKELGKSYNGKTVFKNISGEINRGDRIGLVGQNGIGKTTLAKLLAGRENCDTGQITRSPSGLKILYLDQHPHFTPGKSVYETVFDLAAQSQPAGDIDTTVRKSLHQIGLHKDQWQLPATSLSGGEKTKLALCSIMFTDFDLLILDEPTSHLDTKSCQQLEELLDGLDCPMLIISHNRFFLDRTVNKVWELSTRGLAAYEGNYSAYRKQKEIETKNLTREYDKQQSRIRHLRQVINERANWYRSAHKAAGQNDFYRSKAKKHAGVLKAKRKELARLEKEGIDKPPAPVSPAFEIINKCVAGKKYPRYLVQVKNLNKSFARHTILQDVTFDIKRGDKIALLGDNGAGKTTLLRIICGLDKEYQGTVTVNPSVKIGYFAQEFNHLRDGATILDNVLQEGITATEARLLLACLLFRGDDVYKRIADLSMGEKGRVAFARLILSGADILALDEPTNFMDIEAKEQIEAVLDDFKGVLLLVSHDRYLIHRVANRIFTIEKGKLSCYDGNYDYYLAKCREQEARDTIGAGYGHLADNIRRLECELAFLGARLNETTDEEEKSQLSEKYLAAARELNAYKNQLKQAGYLV